MTIGGGFEQRGVGRGLRWPRNRDTHPDAPNGYKFLQLLERRPEIRDIGVMPRVQEVLKESV